MIGIAVIETAAGGYDNNGQREAGEDVENQLRALAVAAAVYANPNFHLSKAVSILAVQAILLCVRYHFAII